ncbi:hypothetical protein FHS18_003584 [Paenibacillus phyllosphaerae]|uniref:Alpha-L-rhamnosidase n=1 Tax=Paenibacillus phyllosphaerae TaxID=274593 RepID=A0A7W5B0M6_9BACL|nr:hypothetical protein [Paenibacillus phyllosphaerae]MBB3111516.1 hypothetical protein [Paenibacillus phyllosphaerae]
MKKELTFLSFWAINDSLHLGRLNRQLDDMRAAGFDGVVFHPRQYPDDPPYLSDSYFSLVSEVILYAKSIGMTFWIYDENGWPSGIAGGDVLLRRPECRCEWIEWEEQEDGGKIRFGSKQAVSSLDGEATALFLQLTYDGYRTGLTPEAFGHVAGFFSDEVAFLDGHGLTLKTGAIPWDARVVERYRSRFGGELLPLLPLLFTPGVDAELIRARYWELLTDLLADNFYRPVADWCAKYGKKFTAHLKAEEHPYFQLSYSGSCLEMLRFVETPAVDALERYPGNDYYPKIARSVAMQQGRDGALAEVMGGGGWGVSPEAFTNYMLWLAGHGIETFVVHLNQYRLGTQAIQDWPPSMPGHMTWRGAFPSLLDRIKETAARQPDLAADPELLIVVPTRGVMAGFVPREAMGMNEHDGSQAPDTEAARLSLAAVQLVEAIHRSGIHAELTEERTLEREGSVEGGKLCIGRRAYSRVLFAEGCLWFDEGIADRLITSGIDVLTPSDWREAMKACEEAAAGDTAYATADAEAESVNLADALSEAVSVTQDGWTIRKLPLRNQMPLEWETAADGRLTASIRLDQSLICTVPLKFFLHDRVESLLVNGRPLTLTPEGDGYSALWAASDADGSNDLASSHIMELVVTAVPAADGEPCPAAYVRGNFVVNSQSAWTVRDGRQLQTEGPFFLGPQESPPDSSNLIAAGYPFCDHPVTAAKSVWLPRLETACSLRLTGIAADAAFVSVDGRPIGWCWGPDWASAVPAGAYRAGETIIEVELYPSTFNAFGPHRHVDGDRHLVSPDQFKGVKNFADRPDAPDHTKSSQWHAIQLGLSGPIKIIAPPI